MIQKEILDVSGHNENTRKFIDNVENMLNYIVEQHRIHGNYDKTMNRLGAILTELTVFLNTAKQEKHNINKFLLGELMRMCNMIREIIVAIKNDKNAKN